MQPYMIMIRMMLLAIMTVKDDAVEYMDVERGLYGDYDIRYEQ